MLLLTSFCFHQYFEVMELLIAQITENIPLVYKRMKSILDSSSWFLAPPLASSTPTGSSPCPLQFPLKSSSHPVTQQQLQAARKSSLSSPAITQHLHLIHLLHRISPNLTLHPDPLAAVFTLQTFTSDQTEAQKVKR